MNDEMEKLNRDQRSPADNFSGLITRVGKRRLELAETLKAELCVADTSGKLQALRVFIESLNLPTDRRNALLSVLENLDEVQADKTTPREPRLAIVGMIGATTTIIIELAELWSSQSVLDRTAIMLLGQEHKMSGKKGGHLSVIERRRRQKADMSTAADAYNVLSKSGKEPTLADLADYLNRNRVKLQWPAKGGWIGRLKNLGKKSIVKRAVDIRANQDSKSRILPR